MFNGNKVSITTYRSRNGVQANCNFNVTAYDFGYGWVKVGLNSVIEREE